MTRVVADKYRVERVLGKGGMGTVYLAENLDIGRKVALKVLHAALGADDDIVKRFRQEARASATIAHGNIVDVLDMGVTGDGEAYIVMELLVGETLAARRERRVTLPVGETAAILCEVLDGLAAAHAKGFVHRDLKPENIFLTWQPRWAVKILDFGISRVLGADELRVTASNVVMGSVLYMAPEQAKDARSAGAPADLYAIGAIAYQLLAGVPPFVGANYAEVMAALLTDRAAPIAERAPGVPAELAACIDALLAKDPARRPGATEVRAVLLAAAGGALPAVVDERQAKPEPEAFDPLAETAVVPEPSSSDGGEVGRTVATTTGRPATAAIDAIPSRMIDAPREVPPRRSRAMPYAIGGAGVLAAIVAIGVATRGSSAPPPPPPADARAIDAQVIVVDAPAPPDAAAPLDAPPPIDAAAAHHIPAVKVPDAAPPPDAAPAIDASRGLLQLPDPDQPH